MKILEVQISDDLMEVLIKRQELRLLLNTHLKNMHDRENKKLRDESTIKYALLGYADNALREQQRKIEKELNL